MVKPDLTYYFAQMPFIGRYLEYDYECINSLSQMNMVCCKWESESKETNNITKKILYQQSVDMLRGILKYQTLDKADLRALTYNINLN